MVPQDESPPFTFPAWMNRETAAQMLAVAYADVNDGRMLRRALKRQRRMGLDPPMDPQYVVQPALQDYDDGLGVGLNADILLYEEFEGVQECLRVFEDVVGTELIAKLQRRVRKWVKRNPRPHAAQ